MTLPATATAQRRGLGSYPRVERSRLTGKLQPREPLAGRSPRFLITIEVPGLGQVSGLVQVPLP